MRRLPDWRTRFAEEIEKHRDVPWRFGGCVFFCADCVLAMTGEDVAARFRAVNTEEQQTAVLAAAGVSSYTDVIAAAFEEIPPPRAATGDVALVRVDDVASPGMVNGADVMVVGRYGLSAVSLTTAFRAFRVG